MRLNIPSFQIPHSNILILKKIALQRYPHLCVVDTLFDSRYHKSRDN